MRSKALLTLAASTMLVLPNHCDAGGRRARRVAIQPQPAKTYTHPVYHAPTDPAELPPAPAAPAADTHGFVAWLNATRASHGLRPVVADADLQAWAAANSARGFGHFLMGPARRQNAGMGSYAAVCSQWLASPAHRDALLDPSITSVGIAVVGSCWTFNGR